MGLQTVEMMLFWEKAFGIELNESEAARMRTPGSVADLIAEKLAAVDAPGPCLSRRAFVRIRNAAAQIAGTPPTTIKPKSRCARIIPCGQFQTIRDATGIGELPHPGMFFGPKTFGDLSRWSVANAPHSLRDANAPWTRGEVRQVVRAVVSEVLNLRRFKDTADFYRDLGAG